MNCVIRSAWLSAFGLMVTSDAQIVDIGSVHAPLYTAGDGSSTGVKGFSLKMDTGAQSLEGTYFNPFREKWLWGADAKLSAQNGVLNIDSWPKTDLSFIVNRSDYLGDPETSDYVSVWSLTFRETPFFSDDKIFDKTRASGTELYQKTSIGNNVAVTLAFVPGGFSWLAFAISAGHSATNNYSELSKVNVGSVLVSNGEQSVSKVGKAARSGIYKTYNAFPLTFMAPVNLDAIPALAGFSKGFSNVSSNFFEFFGADKHTSYIPVLSPYATYVPRDLGKPANSAGMTFVVRGLNEKGKLTFPIAFYVERQNAFSGKPGLSVGAALTYKWP
jgi:hypothetical protein